MAMIKCPECGQEISDKAKKCVHCGKVLIEDKPATKAIAEKKIRLMLQNVYIAAAHLKRRKKMNSLYLNLYLFKHQ